MDDLKIKKIWEDDNFFEVEIMAYSQFVNAKVNVYVSKQMILQAQNEILDFLNKKIDICTIELGGSSNSNYLASIKMNMSMKATGYIIIETKMRLDDNSVPQHECSFYLYTEYGMLEKFANSFNYLCEASIDTKISLCNE